MQRWRCNVCGYEAEADNAPDSCPSCGSLENEFYVKGNHPKDKLDGNAELLIINGSKHRGHNTAYFASLAEEVAKEKGVTYKIIHLADYNIDHCWCCYSMKEDMCRIPCRNAYDDMHKLHDVIMNAKAVLVFCPINWNGMTSRMKVFLDRLTCIENMYLINKSTPLAGRTVGIVINGHEDGAYKTAFDIFMVFQNLGYALAPYGIAYSTHGRQYTSESDIEFFKTDDLMRTYVRNVAHNVIEHSRLEISKKMKILPSCE
ncbi:flavodoxin [Methanocella sp. CWC-04]|uniref:Flavodoxin n=1 Tax=Methanooceanicella nereidis TaxID=2052831 RepID=A0AAP2RDH1_9EURY|nr:NAD(P)H-dependent oxidoreductase [Methanocella sp. CWC-04]MCD1295606.1 flavodoxin [Methanocella sp. CWC-04]